MSVGWNVFLLTNISFLFFSKLIALHQNVLTLRWMIFPQDVNGRCGHDTRLLRPSCTHCRRTANLPISHHSNHIAKWKKKILVNMVFKINVGYTDLATRKIQSRLGSRVSSLNAYTYCRSFFRFMVRRYKAIICLKYHP